MNSLPQWFYIFYTFLVGICIGSFLNVAILRGLKDEPMVLERSKCPKCNNQLKWYMNIPLLSYIFLRGKCAYCSCHISFQYPLIELITGISFLACYFAFGMTFKAIFSAIILCFFILLSATDIKETVILDYHAYALLVVALIYSGLGYGEVNLLGAFLGAIFGFLIFEIMARIGLLLVNFRMFGEGDSLIALGLGAIFGWKNFLIIVALSFLVQTIFAIPLLIKKAFKQNKKQLALSYILVSFGIVGVVALNYFKLYENMVYYLIFVVLIIFCMGYALKNIVFEINQKKKDVNEIDFENTEFSLFPFGPALIIASTLCLFYLREIKDIILNVFF